MENETQAMSIKENKKTPKQWGLRLLIAMGVLGVMVALVLMPMYF